MNDEPNTSRHADSAHGCCGGDGRKDAPGTEVVTAKPVAELPPTDALFDTAEAAGSCCGGNAGKHPRKH